MKNRIISTMLFCLLSITSNALNLQTDSIINNDLINIWISQSEKQEHVIKLYIQNQQTDTVILKSSFYLDNIESISYILVNRCIQITSDSVYCMWNPIDELNPTRIEYGDKWLYLPPKQIVYIEIPIRRDYVEYEVYFEARLLLLYKRKSYICMKETNKIYMERYKKEKNKTE